MNELDLFAAAIAIDDMAPRAALLDRECAGRPELRARLDQLLAAHFDQLGAMQTGTYHAPGATTADYTPAESAGAIIAGRYKLLQQIGEGGMGTVWMADQTEPVKRRVAVKLVRVERGQSKAILARFEAERQAIALMDHPHIAKLLDAGTTEAGAPYFVMELVKGVPLNDYCDAHKLGIPERLNLFVQICSAVQHAHQKGIIHRDIKPSNILVESHDGKPVPKVIDFGLAKATSGMQLTENTLFTGFGTVMGTPLYMAPEQANFNAVDVDTRADVYSLGVILYELLTGTTPLTRDSIKKAALDEMLKLIREQEAPTPSSRLSSSEAKPTVAANRQMEPLKLGRLVRGELDWIVLKALSKDRDRRYETANGFAADIGRFLNHEAVSAGPVSSVYKLKKFVRRNRGQVIAAGLVFFALMAGIAGTTFGLLRANRAVEAERAATIDAMDQKEKAVQAATAEKAANAQAQVRLTQIEKGNAVLTSIFDDLDIRKVKEGTEPLEAVLAKRLVKAAEQLEGDAIGDPLVVAGLQNKLGEILIHLGYANEAVTLLLKALETRTTKQGADHSGTLSSMDNLATAYHDAGKLDFALPLFVETLKLRKAKLGADHLDTIESMNNLARGYLTTNKNDLALPLLEDNLKLYKVKLGADHPKTLISMNNLAAGYKAVGKLDLALPLLEETLKLMKVKLGADHPDTLTSMGNLAVGYQAAGKLDLALPLYEETLKLMKAKLGADHPHTLTSMGNLARCYQAIGKLDLALPLYEETLKLTKIRLGAGHPNTLTCMGNLAEGYKAVGKPDLAMTLLKETLILTKAKLGADHPDTLRIMGNLADSYYADNRLDLALPLLEERLKLSKTKLGADHPSTLSCVNNLALCYQAVGKLDLALPLLEENLKHLKAKLGADHPNSLRSMSNLALDYEKAGKLDLAQTLLEEALKLMKIKNGSDHPDTLNCMNCLAANYWKSKRLDKSIPLFEDTLKLQEVKLGREHLDTLITLANLGVNYKDAGRFPEALPLLEEAYRASKTHASLRFVGPHLFDVYYKLGRTKEAATLIAELLNIARGSLPKESQELANELARLGKFHLQIKAFSDTEPLLRECLTIREKLQPDLWSTFNTHSMLGGALLGQKKYADAEPLLLKGYEGLKAREKSIPPDGKIRIPEAIDRLIELYTAMEKPDELKKWQEVKAKLPKPESPKPMEKK